ncbi:MAG TPA: TOMM precursor leader peptide-binding protein [Mycobacterium sp.]|nr:TOMM precursor leader peptide-binding protein [Mycobacterium sp.]
MEDLRVFQMPDGLGIQLHFGDAPVVMRGRLAEDSFVFLQKHLDGTRDLDQLSPAIPADLPVETVGRTLWLLHTKGLLVDGEPSDHQALTWRAPDPVIGRQLLFWGRHIGDSRAASSGEVLQRRLGHATVIIVGTGLFGVATADLLSRSGCGQLKFLSWDDGPAGSSESDTGITSNLLSSPITPTAWASARPANLHAVDGILRDWLFDADLIVTATRNAPDRLFEEINRICQQAAKPWLRGNLEASSIELGPYVHPGSSACFSCLQLRRRSADPLAIEHELDHAARAQSDEAGGIPPIGEALFAATLGASQLTGEVIRVVTGIAMPALLNRVVTVSPTTGEQHTNNVLRVPRCPDCSKSAVTLAERGRA